MNNLIDDFFQVGEIFDEVIPLHDLPLPVSGNFNLVPQGWVELSQLPPEDRISFTFSFWSEKLPYVPHIQENLKIFFSRLDDIGIFLTKGSGFEACRMVYSLSDNSSFFLGNVPSVLGNQPFPDDFLAFCQIHSGFSKWMDTGIFPLDEISIQKDEFLAKIEELGIEFFIDEKEVDPMMLTPFYRSFGRENYQCFYADWYPNERMGNVFCSLSDGSISDVSKNTLWEKNLAFTSFLDWLIFYLEGIGGVNVSE